ncbi:hypothetical protein MED01_002486 [Micromonospora sp. MED01]|uniref:hypothetical protein n=1 Tax=Micromonospora alfalfae TaxID=2911212 RepID=UPI001EE83CC7|nr:hypothetical protein [Micromonospora alfalfae]MCG5464320.1 hypothetical protein [Micromonospora alfalfae]
MTDTATTISPDERRARLDGPVHHFFGLTYSNYQVIPRALMQSMPVEWQERMVACIEELQAAYTHLDHPDTYEVTAAVECEYSDLNDADMRQLGITQPDAADGDGDEIPDVFYDKRGDEHQSWERLLVPRVGGDPIPHYDRGRTFVEPAA